MVYIAMKKFNTRNLRHWLRAANKRFKRGNRTKGPGALGTLGVRYLNPNFQDLKFDKNSFSPTVNAPPQLDLYMRPNIELFANFLENLRLTSKYNNHVLISFRDTHYNYCVRWIKNARRSFLPFEITP